MSLGADFLVRQVDEPTEILREDLEDALKEYSELDVIVELLQNALDAIDYRRYVAICVAANRAPDDPETVTTWNAAVVGSLEADHEEYDACQTAAEKANLYKRLSEGDQSKRREAWWARLAAEFGASAEEMAEAAAKYHPRLVVTVREGPPSWLEVEDNALGMADIAKCFRHKSSTKRNRQNSPRRLGTRGSHGWGLTAVLGMSDRIEVLSRAPDEPPAAYAFSNYASFVSGSVGDPTNEEVDLSTGAAEVLSSRLRGNEGESGTHIRVRLAEVDQRNLLGRTLRQYNPERFATLLRLYTPIGQINDYVLHPAFHCVRKHDLSVTLRSIASDGTASTKNISFDFFRLSEAASISQVGFDTYVNTGWPPNVSVHTVHREKGGGHVYLSAADIQGSELIQAVEEEFKKKGSLPEYIDPTDTTVSQIPRGIQLALSGGMRSEFMARPSVGNMAMLRGVILAETARPTLGRKYTMDQRETIPKAARAHQTAYEEVRRKLRPQAVPPVATPAQAKWRREFFDKLLEDLEQQQPLSHDLGVWAGRESLEARVMLSFGELLARGAFGRLKVLRAHLQDRYDFAYLYSAMIGEEPCPTAAVAAKLVQSGYAIQNNQQYQMYGIGEFKAAGETVFSDFDPNEPRKSPDTLDLLVCWEFDQGQVEAQNWAVEEATEHNAEVHGQTHIWMPGGDKYVRTRGLAVVALKTVIERLVKSVNLGAPPAPWPGSIPDSYL